MFGADLVVNESAFHAGAILLLKVNFLTFILPYSAYNLYSVFLVMSDLVAPCVSLRSCEELFRW